VKKDAPVQHAELNDDAYLKIWEVEQKTTTSRWTIATFFIGISFAIFGFSFQVQLISSLPNLARITGLLIYWFSFLLFWRFNAYNKFLRAYLLELEAAKRTSLDIQTRSHQVMYTGLQKYFSATWLLLYFGIVYAIGVAILWSMGL
jgi:hypothetical protein